MKLISVRRSCDSCDRARGDEELGVPACLLCTAWGTFCTSSELQLTPDGTPAGKGSLSNKLITSQLIMKAEVLQHFPFPINTGTEAALG